MAFIGRQLELSQLKRFYERPVAGLAVCCGRRRIGKSTLIEHSAKGARFIEFYGLAPRQGSSNRAQLNQFSKQLAEQFQIPEVGFHDWQDALNMLAGLTKEGEVTILLDEISWMAAHDKDFPGKLKGIWDTKLKKNPKLKLILCGSVSSWIKKNILNNKAFVGRVSLTIDLEELPLPDCNQFWHKTQLVSAREKLTMLCVTGGVPRYLEEIEPHRSAEENIKQLCFTKGGLLVNEFDTIFNDIFGNQAESYKDIVRVILNKPLGIDTICERIGIKPSGNFNNKLKTLAECGFLHRDYVWNGKKRAKKFSKYRLCDNYLRFYLKYIEPKKDLIEKGIYENIHIEYFNDWHTTLGLQFENLILNNLNAIIKLLNISPESIQSASPYFQNTTKRKTGCQIDLMIQTQYNWYICEIKFSNAITIDIINQMENKIKALSIPKSVSIRPVLIYQGELSPAVKMSNYFSHLITFEELLQSFTSPPS